MKKLFVFSLLMLLIIGCRKPSSNPNVFFDNPQPTDAKDLNEFPFYLRGKYINSKSHETLYISDKSIIIKQQILLPLLKSELDTSKNFIRVKNKIIDKSTNIKFSYDIHKDTFLLHFFNDTTYVFKLSKTNIIRRTNNKIILNSRTQIDNKDVWEVATIDLNWFNLKIGNFYSLIDEKHHSRLLKITKTEFINVTNEVENANIPKEEKNDSINQINQIIFHSTPLEFRKLIQYRDSLHDSIDFTTYKKVIF
jgi:hypothetical protein